MIGSFLFAFLWSQNEYQGQRSRGGDRVVMLNLHIKTCIAHLNLPDIPLHSIQFTMQRSTELKMSLKEDLGKAAVAAAFGLAVAAGPAQAEPLYRLFQDCVRQHTIPVASGEFGASMEVHLVNNGPVTLLLDSQRSF